VKEFKHVRSLAGGDRYRFPTHVNELIFDRAETQRSEVFLVVLQPGEAPPTHVHKDMEQVFYIVAGTGWLRLGDEGGERTKVRPGRVVYVPPGTPHAILNTGRSVLRYVAVNVLTRRNKREPTWDSHVRNVCASLGWDYEQIRGKAAGAP